MSDNEGLQMTTGTLTRGQRIWQRVRETRDTTISLWRARLLTESWKETERYCGKTFLFEYPKKYTE